MLQLLIFLDLQLMGFLGEFLSLLLSLGLNQRLLLHKRLLAFLGRGQFLFFFSHLLGKLNRLLLDQRFLLVLLLLKGHELGLKLSLLLLNLLSLLRRFTFLSLEEVLELLLLVLSFGSKCSRFFKFLQVAFLSLLLFLLDHVSLDLHLLRLSFDGGDLVVELIVLRLQALVLQLKFLVLRLHLRVGLLKDLVLRNQFLVHFGEFGFLLVGFIEILFHMLEIFGQVLSLSSVLLVENG